MRAYQVVDTSHPGYELLPIVYAGSASDARDLLALAASKLNLKPPKKIKVDKSKDVEIAKLRIRFKNESELISHYEEKQVQKILTTWQDQARESLFKEVPLDD